MEFFRTWPGDWRARIQRLIADERGGSTLIDFVVGDESMTGITFFEVSGGLITHITDYWPSPYEPPARMTPLVARY